MPYCPECGKQVSLTAKFCRECGCDLKVDDTEQVQPQASSSEQKCARHPKMNAVGVCAECGSGVCVICKSGVKDKPYCPNCIGAIDGPVKGNYVRRDLDWLQNFRRQYEEVVQLSLELQSIAKGMPLTSRESENKISDGVGERLKELQRSFANIEMNNGPKPKSSDLRKMNRSLQGACVYFGVACVALRKWAERPSSSIEAYTTERLELAGKDMDKVNEQLALLSNKPAAVKNDAIREDLKTSTSGNVETPSKDEEILKFKDVINGVGQPLKIQATIMITALSCSKSISDRWADFVSQSPSMQIDFAIRAEMLFFFLHMTCRHAFSIGGPQFRANLQDRIVESSIRELIRHSFHKPSGERPSFDAGSWAARGVGEVLERYNEAEFDYGYCERLVLEHNGDSLCEDTVLGKLTKRINDLDDKKDNHSLRLYVFKTAVESLAKAGLQEQVEEIHRRGLELNPDNTATLDNHGNTVAGAEHYEEVLSDYNRSLELHSDDPEMLCNRGNTLAELERYEEALSDYNRSLELRPDDPETLYNRGNTLVELERYEEALKDYNLLLKLQPDDSLGLASRGDVLHELGRYKEALHDYNRSLEVSPDDSLTLESRGNTLLALERYEEALNDYNRSLELEPDNTDALESREIVLGKLKQDKPVKNPDKTRQGLNFLQNLRKRKIDQASRESMQNLSEKKHELAFRKFMRDPSKENENALMLAMIRLSASRAPDEPMETDEEPKDDGG